LRAHTVKILLGTDLEGVAGVVSFEDQAQLGGRYYEGAKRLLAGEVNAAIEGARAAGAEEIVVIDGHGPGALDAAAIRGGQLVHGRPLAARSVRQAFEREFDACMMVGQHAMAGIADGCLNHTQNSTTVDYYQLNGRPIGEIAQFALARGALGLPLIFLSGDEAACREARALQPRIVTAAVQRGLSRNCAISLAHDEACRRIREAAAEAVRAHRRDPVPPVAWPGPYMLIRRYFFSNLADVYDDDPRAVRLDPFTVRLTSDDVLDVIYG